MGTKTGVYMSFKKYRFLLMFLSFHLCAEDEKNIGYNYFKPIDNPYGFSKENLSSIQNRTIVLTVPRSGTSLTCAMCSFLTELPLFWLRNKSEWKRGVYLNRFNIPLNYDLFPILATHNFNEVAKLSHNNKLVMTVRNYKELLFRDENRFERMEEFLKKCVNHLRVFDKWEKNNRLLIYYEDLVERPNRVIEQLAEFLQTDPIRTEELVENFEMYRQRCFETYKASKSPGQDVSFHTKEVPKATLKKIDQMIRELDPKIYREYFKRYQEF